MQQSYIQELQEDFDKVLKVALGYAEKDKVFTHNYAGLRQLEMKYANKSVNSHELAVRELMCNHQMSIKLNNKERCYHCLKNM